MGRRPADQDTPDLFPTATVRDASAPPKSLVAGATTLPKNLRNAVKHLSDGELDLMLAATLEEMKRRGRTPSADSGLLARPNLIPPTEKRRHVDTTEVPLTRGQVNAVRAAFNAGITPSRIARQFGISQSNVRKALASDEQNR
jgi:DNA invertase Pin-like site-specific DNA recombinase